MLEQLKDDLEIMICVNSKDLLRNKIRADLGITYEDDVLRLVDVFRERGFWWKTSSSPSWKTVTTRQKPSSSACTAWG